MNNEPVLTKDRHPAGSSDWQEIVARYQKPALRRSVWQVINTLVPYVFLWWLMYFSVEISWWITTPLAVLAGGFLVRVFIIHHDCGHGSFFESRKPNEVLGFATGVLTFTPYHHWRWQHARHHASCGDLDRRGTGDVWTLTVREYLESPRWKRFAYRLVRLPVVLFVIAPLFLFIVRQRIPKAGASRRERHSVYWTNLAILGLASGLIWAFGLKAYLVIQLTTMGVAGTVGMWLFYVQHQFEGVYWRRSDKWSYTAAALQGSSFYKLPKVLQWFSGNIGFHHIHHLSARIPNYYLEDCHKADPLFQSVKPISLSASLKSLAFRLWDEQRHQLVGFSYLSTLRRQGKPV